MKGLTIFALVMAVFFGLNFVPSAFAGEYTGITTGVQKFYEVSIPTSLNDRRVASLVEDQSYGWCGDVEIRYQNIHFYLPIQVNGLNDLNAGQIWLITKTNLGTIGETVPADPIKKVVNLEFAEKFRIQNHYYDESGNCIPLNDLVDGETYFFRQGEVTIMVPQVFYAPAPTRTRR